MMNFLSEKYKDQIRTSYFKKAKNSRRPFAFAGTGLHAVNNLYPVIRHLGIHLKYIYSRRIENSRNAAALFSNCAGVNDVQIIIDDADTRDVFLCLKPELHYDFLNKLLQAGKNVYVEKPPCRTYDELLNLCSYQSSICHVGLQQRYAPGIRLLKSITTKTEFYSLQYLTGLYTEGDVLTELFIHPLDILHQLFGRSIINAVNVIAHKNTLTVLLQLKHESGPCGQVELSTAYNWVTASENIKLHTGNEIWEYKFPHEVTVTKLPASFAGLPLEKIRPVLSKKTVYNSDNLATSFNNQMPVAQGFYQSVEAFVISAEKNETGKNHSLHSLLPVYEMIEIIRKHL